MMDELKPCRCGGTARLWTSPTGDFIRCDVCGFTISYLGGFDDALLVEEWNRRIKPENKPLTLEQLRQKIGKPVFIVDGNVRTWTILERLTHNLAVFTESSRCTVWFPIAGINIAWFPYDYESKRS